MTAHVLISGNLYRDPEPKTSKAGRPFITATVRVKDGDAAQWWKVLAFSTTACSELIRLKDGDAVSVQGTLKLDTYEKGGETKISMTVMADIVLALRQPPRQRKKPDEPPRREPSHELDRYGGDGVDHFGDDVGF